MMKKFLQEYKNLQKLSATEVSNDEKWERVTVSSRRDLSSIPPNEDNVETVKTVGTIRTEEYKRDLAEFQARRSAGKNDQVTPIKKKCGRNSLPVSCTSCKEDLDKSFNYEKKSGSKYKSKRSRSKSATSQDKIHEALPNIQFVFQNQVFMPGNVFTNTSFSDPRRPRRIRHRAASDQIFQKHIDFKEDDEQLSSPTPVLDNEISLPIDVKKFLGGCKSEEEVDGAAAAGDKGSSGSSCSSGKDDSCRDKLVDVMSELKNFDQWADEQLKNTCKSDDNKSDSNSSTYGLPLVTTSDLDVFIDKEQNWNNGKWGVVPVQMKKLPGVTLEQVKKSQNVEINILRKCRHPNVILLMGLYTDIYNNIHIICERCDDSLFNMLHAQGRTLSVQTSLRYTLDIANALLFLRMRGYIHSELTSHSVMVTTLDSAKLCDFKPCVAVGRKNEEGRIIDQYSPLPQYVNIGDTLDSSLDCEPLLSANPSSVYLATQAGSKDYFQYRDSFYYRWHAPELFTPDSSNLVYPCSRSDVYSLCLILWECCNAEIPFKKLTYEELKDQYTIWNIGMRVPSDGSYPGSVLDLLKQGLLLTRQRPSLEEFMQTLAKTKEMLEDVEYVIIPTCLSKKKSDFSSIAWDESPTVSECLSPINNIHHADVHNKDISTENNTKSDDSVVYETIRRDTMYAKTCFIPDDETDQINYKNYSLTRSTPVSKVKARIREFESPGLHRSDSTEYCSIMSPNQVNFDLNLKDLYQTEKSTAKLSRSFTPKSYKPLHIKVPEFNLDCLKSLPKDQMGKDKSSYNFDIKNYSLPSTPIARSNKLRRNAWLSGDLSFSDKADSKKSNLSEDTNKTQSPSTAENSPSPDNVLKDSDSEKDAISEGAPCSQRASEDQSPGAVGARDSFTGLRRTSAPPADFSPVESRERTHSWSFKSIRSDRLNDTQPYCDASSKQDEALRPKNQSPTRENESLRHETEPWRPGNGIAVRQNKSSRRENEMSLHENDMSKRQRQTFISQHESPRRKSEPAVPTESPRRHEEPRGLSVKPLVAIHERWIMEARRKTARSTSLPNDTRSNISALKPASHCVDTLQKSLPQLTMKRPINKFLRANSTVSANGRNGSQSEQFVQARDMIAKSMNFAIRDSDVIHTSSWRKEDKCDKSDAEERPKPTVHQSTDTGSIEDFIRDLIRKEFHQLLQEITDDKSSIESANQEILDKGVENVLNILESKETNEVTKRSTLKINGNNRPLVQISFSNAGENCMQVVDNCLNVTVSDSKLQEKLNQSMNESMILDDHQHSLKRCQAFSAIQDARSTEDLYIDDELSTQMQESFGGRVKLIPLHGSLHEILCEREDDCCLQKVKQENCCDVVYFKCDNSDTESRDAIDGRDTLLYKRKISFIRESVQRLVPKDRLIKRIMRPKSEVFFRKINTDVRKLSRSTPTLFTKDNEGMAHNLSYQDSSSDECLESVPETDEFEQLEEEIEAQLAKSSTYLSCTMEKISEESLSAIKEEGSEKE